VVVDSVSHVIRIPESEIAPSPPFVGGLSGKYVSGVAKLDERLIVVLDMEKILSTEEMIELNDFDSIISHTGVKEQEV
jgi:purine-binding chemotaxis protein CheW